MSPSTSVVIVTHNMGRYLPCAVQSVFRQTNPNWELIIVDDCSSDDTRGYLESLSDERISTFFNDDKRGIPKSRNRALAECRGEFISILDADDWFLPEKIENHARVLSENASIGVVSGRAIVLFCERNSFHIGVRPKKVESDFWDLTTEYQVVHSATTWRREAIERCGGYDESLDFNEDVDLYFRVGDMWKQSMHPGFAAVKREFPGAPKSYPVENMAQSSRSIYEKTMMRRYGRLPSFSESSKITPQDK